MRINVVNVEKSAIPGKKYHQLEVAYKDEKGELKGRKVMSFGIKNGLDILTNASAGDALDVTLVEEKGYWNWTSIAKASSEAPSAPSVKTGGYSAPSRDFETSVERAKKQVYIVRQSSISSAIALYAKGEVVPHVSDVLEVAKLFEAYVFGQEPSEVQEVPEDNS